MNGLSPAFGSFWADCRANCRCCGEHFLRNVGKTDMKLRNGLRTNGILADSEKITRLWKLSIKNHTHTHIHTPSTHLPTPHRGVAGGGELVVRPSLATASKGQHVGRKIFK